MTTLMLFDDRVTTLLGIANATILAISLFGIVATLAVIGVRRLFAARAAARCISEIEAFLRGQRPDGRLPKRAG